MKDYSAMSDFEINKQVAIELELKPYYEDGSYSNDGLFVVTRGPRCLGRWNPCNESHQAWSIIVASNISLHAPRFKEGWMAEFTGSDEDVNDEFDVDYFESKDANPLRAAMTVFLMMKDAEKCDG